MFYMMRAVLLGLLFIVNAEWGLCQEAFFDFDGDIRHFAVGTNSVYVVTDERLYQFSHSLTLLHSLFQRGVLQKGREPWDDRFLRVSESDNNWNATFTVNTLVPFIKNNTLITCGVIECGYCELLDLNNISKLVYEETFQVGSLSPSSASTGFLVDVEGERKETYILTAIGLQPYTEKCLSIVETVNLQNTNDGQVGGIFSYEDRSGLAHIRTRSGSDVTFVDGFQIQSTIYLFSNVLSQSKIRLIYLEGNVSKSETVKSLQGATLHCCDDRERTSLRSSSVIPGGPPVLWAGVFVGSDPNDPLNTALVIFDISPAQSGATDTDPDFCFYCGSSTRDQEPRLLKPEKVLLKHNSMSSVLAVRQKSWLVFFIGTGDGQLIKLAVDKAYETACPKVLYRASDDRRVFPKMHLDPVDSRHVYMVLENQMRRVPVSQCATYTSLQECWSAQDPFCGWCASNSRCSFEDECPDSVWLSIPDDAGQKKIISYRIDKSRTGQITLTIDTHLSVGGTGVLTNFACQFSTSIGELCDRAGPVPRFPQCSCSLSNNTLPAKGLDVTVRIRLDKGLLMEQLKLISCSGTHTSALCHQCITAGCSWSSNVCSWSHTGVLNDRVCQTTESRPGYLKPEISSIHPSVVSFYGRNHALMIGTNLSDVTRVRLQGDMECSPKESPVWSNTGVSLTFHMPRGNKGLVKVCAVLPDGSCHGSASISYRSSPSCTGITPTSAWASGKRRIMVQGSHLEFVDGMVHSHAPRIISIPTNSSFGVLFYEAPAAEDMSTGMVSLRVANETLACSQITYHPDPEFISFSSTRTGDDLRVTVQKKADQLKISPEELTVLGFEGKEKHTCDMEAIKTGNSTDSVICEIRSTPDANIQSLQITFGNVKVNLTLTGPSGDGLPLRMVLVFLLIPCIVVGVALYAKRRIKRERVNTDEQL